MSKSDEWELTGRHVLLIMLGAFGIIIAVNLTLAWQAVGTFPGLETKNSYVVSQSFQEDRAAQEALGWDVSAVVYDGALRLAIRDANGQPVRADIAAATLGRATHTREDQTPEFLWSGTEYVAPVSLGRGNWNLRLAAVAPDGTPFRQRLVISVRD